MRNIILVISGPSGVGKGTIAKTVLKNNDNIVSSVSYTTRKPRENEIAGVDYNYISDEEFEKRIKENSLLEYSGQFGHYYGTPKEIVDETLKTKSILLEIDVNGGLNVKKLYGDRAVLVFIYADRKKVIERLTSRNTESAEEIKIREARFDYEMQRNKQYDYVVKNDLLSDAVKQVEEIIFNETNK